MPTCRHLVYLSELSSPYDSLFLSWLTETYRVTCITFNQNPVSFASNPRVIKVRDSPFELPRIDGVRIWAFTLGRSYLIKRLLSKIEPDLAITNNALSYGLYSALANFRPCLLFVWGSDVLIWPRRSFIFKSLAGYSLRKAGSILVDSDVQFRACVELGASSNKIIKIPWFDINDVQNAKLNNGKERSIRQDLGISEDEILVISTRSHEPVYSVETLILAISKIIKREHKVKFLIIGGGSRTSSLKKLAQRKNLLDKILFTGKTSRKRVLEYLQVSDIYVSTSLSDGTSASLLEAMAYKVPPVVTDISGNLEWIKNGTNGLLFPVRDFNALTEKIVHLIKNEDSRKSLGMKAYRTVARKADWSKNSKLLENLMSSLSNPK